MQLLELQQHTSLQLKKVKLLKHVLMKKSLHSKKILKLIKIKWWKKLATTKFENGDITADDLTKAVQEKTAQVADFAKESFELIKEKTAQVTPEQADVEAETKAIVDDIVIDIKDISEEAAEAK